MPGVPWQIKLLNEYGEEIDKCVWKVQRRRLTAEFIEVSAKGGVEANDVMMGGV